jgi:hypothetical protein
MARSQQIPPRGLREGLVLMRVTSDERANLRRLAQERGLTVSDLMRQAIASYTATDAARPDFHLGVALERLCEDAGISPLQTMKFLEGLSGLMRRKTTSRRKR